MAWLLNRNGTFHIGLRFNGRLFKRSLKTKDSKTANGALGRVEENLRDVERGRLALPENVNLIEFLLSGEQPVAAQSVTPALHISRVVDEYLASIPDGAMEQNSLYTAKIHIKHLTTKLGARFNFSLLKQSDLQAYVSHRAKQKTATRIERQLDDDQEGAGHPSSDLVVREGLRLRQRGFSQSQTQVSQVG